MKKLVVYTCITGAYDVLSDPITTIPGVDFVCFSDYDISRQIWQLRTPVKRQKNSLLTARWHKQNPHLLFPDYEYSLWVDGNVIPASEELYSIVEALMSESVKWAGIKHPLRDDVYEEAFRIYANGRENFYRLARCVNFLKKEGFPRHWGMMETNVILRAHNDEQVRHTDELWSSLLEEYTGRDQMTHSYCMWKTGLTMQYMLPDGYSARNHSAFRYVVHDKPYVKDRSFKGRLADFRRLIKRLCFRLFLRCNGTPL